MTDTPKTEQFRVPVKLFDLGQIVATPGALAACSREYMTQCLGRHIRGDWGCIDAEDRKTNFDAMFSGECILSAYPIDPAKPCEGLARIQSGSSPRATAARPPSCCRLSINPLPRPRQSRRDRVFHHHHKKELEND